MTTVIYESTAVSGTENGEELVSVGNASEHNETDEQCVSRKRSIEESPEEIALRKLKRLRQQLLNPDSNPIMILNEYRRDVRYELVEQSGPSHCPSFTYCLTIDGQRFVCTSSSKKNAKLLAAQNALNCLYTDVASPDFVVPDSGTGRQSERPPCTNPCTMLNKLRPGTTYEPIVNPAEPTGSDVSAVNKHPDYQVQCTVDDQHFEGKGTSFKLAKAHAAEAVLHKLFGIQCTNAPDGFPMCPTSASLLPASNVKTAVVVTKSAVGVAAQPGIQPAAPPVRSVDVQPQLLVPLADGKNPVSFIIELYPGVELTVDDPQPERIGVFVARLSIEDQTFVGEAKTKKVARMSAAINAVNYLQKTGLFHMRLAEKASRRQPSTWPPRPRVQFNQESVTAMRGRGRSRGRGGHGTFAAGGQDIGGFGTSAVGEGKVHGSVGARGGGNRGRGRGGKSLQYSALKMSYTADGSNNAGWVSGGVLKAGDFLGLANASNANAAQYSANYSQYTNATGTYTDTSGYKFYGSTGRNSDFCFQSQTSAVKSFGSSQQLSYGGLSGPLISPLPANHGRGKSAVRTVNNGRGGAVLSVDNTGLINVACNPPARGRIRRIATGAGGRQLAKIKPGITHKLGVTSWQSDLVAKPDFDNWINTAEADGWQGGHTSSGQFTVSFMGTGQQAYTDFGTYGATDPSSARYEESYGSLDADCYTAPAGQEYMEYDQFKRF